MEKKIAKKYADLIVQANNSTGRKETVSLIKQYLDVDPAGLPFLAITYLFLFVFNFFISNYFI